MKKYFYLLLICLSICACNSGAKKTTIHGQISGLSDSTVMLYSVHLDSLILDTISCEQGHFTTDIQVDSSLILNLFIKGVGSYPLFLKSGETVNSKGMN